MAGLQDQAQAFFECIPLENRDKLDRKVDGHHDGVQRDLGQIANSMDEWEGVVAECLGLTKVDCATIRSQHRDNLGLQTRAALQKWQEKNGFRSTYGSLIKIFLSAGKTSFAEAVCKVLDGDPSMIRVPPPKMQYATMPAVGSTGGASQKTRLRTNEDYHNLYSFLGPHAAQWRAIGQALGFYPTELNIIQSNVMLLTQGPSGYLGDMLTKWLQWAPGDGRRSQDFATFEDLREALLKAGMGSVAYDLGPALGLPGEGAPPPSQSRRHTQPTRPPPDHAISMPARAGGYDHQSMKTMPPPSMSVPAYLPSTTNSPQQHSSGFGHHRNSHPYASYQPTASLPKGGKKPVQVHPADKPLTIRSDHLAVVRAIRDLSNDNIIELGQQLGLHRVKLRRMGDLPGDMVSAWLRQEDDVIKVSGDPTWRTLANACDKVGQGRAAKEMREAHDIKQASVEPEGGVAFSEEETQKATTVTDGGEPTSPGQTKFSEEEMCAQFMAKLKEWKITLQDRDLLKENGITSDEAWSMMTLEDLKELKQLTMGGRMILKKHLPQTKPPPCLLPQRSLSRELSLEEDDFCPEFWNTLEQNNVPKKDRKKLLDNGITMWAVLSEFTVEDLKEMDITSDGQKILGHCLKKFQQDTQATTLKDAFSPDFWEILNTKKISEKDRKVLKEHTIITWELFQKLSSKDLEEMELTKGGKKLLGKCLTEISQQKLQENSAKKHHQQQDATPPQLPDTLHESNHSPPPAAASSSESVGQQSPSNQKPDKNYDQERSEMALPRINMVLIVPPVQPPDWNPPETDSDGPSKETSYPPYPRVFKVFAGRSMKHTPKLKLEEDPIKLTKIDTCHVEFPYSLVGNYSMKRRDQRKGHGLCLVINNEKFVSPRHKQRKGTHRDEYNLVETFRFLGYRVEIQRDCKSQDIIHLFDRISFLIEPEDDSFVCCILSHGSNNIVYGSDSEGVTLRTGEDSLEVKLTKCKKLENKPKLFFVSTCRQPKREPKPDSEGHKPEPDSEGQEPEPDSDQNPRADFAFNYATLPGEASWRFTDTGTFYINHLCQVLCKYATQETLSNIQKKVAQEVSKMEKHQMPTLEEQVTKNVYFFDDFFEEASNTTS